MSPDKGKRKSQDSSNEESRKKPKPAAKGKQKQEVPAWPDEFNELFKIFKTINTVLAFCSSRKHLATTFPVVRSSVEALLKRPLDLERVAELKALLPEIVNFAYIPKSEHLINDSSSDPKQGDNEGKSSHHRGHLEDEEHVLILDFAEPKKAANKKAMEQATYQMQPALSPAEVKKLILKRNDRFEAALNELLLATPENEDAVQLLKAAAREHIPINPTSIHDIAQRIGADQPQERPAVPSPQDRASIDDILSELESADWYKGQIVHRKTFEPRAAQRGLLSTPLSDSVKEALKSARNIDTLYTHQAAAIDAVLNNRHVIVSTSTASGKSVIYQVPLLICLEKDPDTKAIFIYPTKALAQDQKTALQHLLFACPSLSHIKVATYDGDTPREQRHEIRDTASVIFTNFDTIHASILPHEDGWRSFLKSLKLVAVDELHYYSGLFGSHVAQVMRRFRRVCAALGNRRVRFISCSATISSPLEHMQNIFGVEDVEVIDQDGAPSGQKEFITWRPPLVDELEPSLGRESAMKQATALMRFLMKRGVRTILFCKIRKICEQAMKTVRHELTAEGRLDVLEKVAAYRGGYSQEDRRRIEREAFGGNLLGIVATNALELGVDIGVLDAVIMLGFPFSIANLRQQSGRAGRRSRDALTVLVVNRHAIDEHYALNPGELFTRPPEPLLVDLQSTVILEAHLQCAGQEMPLCLEDAAYFGPLLGSICDNKLVKDKNGWYHPHPRFLPYPSKHVSIRGVQEEYYTVLDVTAIGAANAGSGKILEEIEFSRALFEAYEGGVFLHQGQTYLVKEVSHDTRLVKVLRTDVNWTTKARDFTNVDALQTQRIREVKGSPCRAFYGTVQIDSTIFGFFKLRGNTILDVVSLETPSFTRGTTGWWMDIPREVLQVMRQKGFNAAEAIHAASHAVLNQFDMQKELRTECKVATKEYKAEPSKRKRPARLMFYDAAGQQGGIAAKAFDHASELVHTAFEVVESCSCRNGCANCIWSPWCKEGNSVSSKLGALVALRAVLGLPIDLSEFPDPETPYDPDMDTVVEASEVPLMGDVTVETYD